MPFLLMAKDMPKEEPTDFDFEATVRDLKRHEGYKEFPYLDDDNSLTIGYGTKLYDPRFLLMAVRMSPEESEEVMRGKLRMIDQELRRQTTAHSARTGEDVPISFKALSPSAKRGLANMAYNMGVPTLMQFGQMWKSLMAGDYRGARRHAKDSRWRKQVGHRAEFVTDLFKEGR